MAASSTQADTVTEASGVTMKWCLEIAEQGFPGYAGSGEDVGDRGAFGSEASTHQVGERGDAHPGLEYDAVLLD